MTVAAVMALGAMAGQATTAFAAQAVSSQSASLTAVSVTDPVPPGTANVCGASNFATRLNGTRFIVYLCVGASVVDISGRGPFQQLTNRVTDRVWLHQTFPARGWADCFETGRPPTTWNLIGRDQNPGDIQLTGNTAHC